MNKNDIKFCLVLGLIALSIYGLFVLTETKKDKKAYVYYENKVVLTIDLSVEEKKEYDVQGYNGNIHIISENGKVKVAEENSPKHLCSKQGYIKESYESIICLPNKVVIKIEDSDQLDTITR